MSLCTQFKKKVTTKSLAITAFFITAIIATAAIITVAFLLSPDFHPKEKLSQLKDELNEVKNSVSHLINPDINYTELAEIVDSAVSMRTDELVLSVDTINETLEQTQNRLNDTTTGLTNLEEALERTQTRVSNITTDFTVLEGTLEHAHIRLMNATINHRMLKDIVTEHIISATNIHTQLFSEIEIKNSAQTFSPSQWMIVHVHVLLIVCISIM